MGSTRLTRRGFLVAGGTAVGALGAVAGCAPDRSGEKMIARLPEIRVGEPAPFSYPGEELAYLIDLGRAVVDGAGLTQSLVAYSGVCQHLGCPVNYERQNERFICPCHASVFDAADNGTAREGPGTQSLPRIQLRVMALDAVDLLTRQGFPAHRLELGVPEWRANGWRIEAAERYAADGRP